MLILFTKEAFEKEYCNHSNIKLAEYREFFVTLPCRCTESDCKGWAVVPNTPLSIKVHKEIYN